MPVCHTRSLPRKKTCAAQAGQRRVFGKSLHQTSCRNKQERAQSAFLGAVTSENSERTSNRFAGALFGRCWQQASHSASRHHPIQYTAAGQDCAFPRCLDRSTRAARLRSLPASPRPCIPTSNTYHAHPEPGEILLAGLAPSIGGAP